MNEFINSASDPFDSDNIPEFYHCKSLGYGGDRPNLTAPSTPNFPPLTPARYYVDLPYIPDQTDLTGTRPMLIKDVTGGVPLTRVTSSPSTNQYRLAASARERNYVIEVNSAQAGHVIAYDYYTAKQPVLAVDMGRLTTVETNIDAIETSIDAIETSIDAIEANNDYGVYFIDNYALTGITSIGISYGAPILLPSGTYVIDSIATISGTYSGATNPYETIALTINGDVWEESKNGGIKWSHGASVRVVLLSPTTITNGVSIHLFGYSSVNWKFSYTSKIYRQY